MDRELTKSYCQFQKEKDKLIKAVTIKFSELFYKYDAEHIVNIDWFCVELQRALYNEVGPFRLK